jgi:hypothetical protein
MVVEIHTTLEQIAEEYVSVWDRPPRLRELTRYLGNHLEEEELFPGCISDSTPWNLREAKFRYRKARKPDDPAELPDAGRPRKRTASGGASPELRVTHPKFGEGVVVEEVGDRVTVQFGRERRVLLARFVKSVR